MRVNENKVTKRLKTIFSRNERSAIAKANIHVFIAYNEKSRLYDEIKRRILHRGFAKWSLGSLL